ncbi:hypothetical protein KUCAC02_024940, partial [Chaenocephalus aceratus]
VEPFPGHVGAFWEQQPAVLNTLLSKKMRRGEAMASLTEDGMTLMPEVITLMSPLKVATTLLTLDPRFKDLAFLDDNETKDIIFMRITAEVVKMDGQAGDGDTLIEDQAAETEGDRSPHREEEETDDVPPMKKTALDQMFGDFLPARSPVKRAQRRELRRTLEVQGEGCFRFEW